MGPFQLQIFYESMILYSTEFIVFMMVLAKQYHICLKLELRGNLLKTYPLNQEKDLMFDQHFDCRDVAFLG